CTSIRYSSPAYVVPLLTSIIPRQPISTLFPYTTLFRSYTSIAVLKIHNQIGSTRLLVRTDKNWESYGGYKTELTREGYGITRLRSEEHTSELQSRFDLVCRLLLEKKKKKR